MYLTILVPMYNERAILPETLAALSRYARETFSQDYELLFVDDGSTDGGGELVTAYPDPALRLLRYEENRGKGYAVRTGMLHAQGELILFTDCDLAYGTAALTDLKDALAEDEQIAGVIGSRALHEKGYEGYTLTRRLLSRAYRAILRLFFGLRLSDSQSGLKGFRREAAREIFSRCETDRFAFDFEAILIAEKLGLSLREIPACVLYNRKRGRVRPVRDGLLMLRDLCRIKRRVKKLSRFENTPHIKKGTKT